MVPAGYRAGGDSFSGSGAPAGPVGEHRIASQITSSVPKIPNMMPLEGSTITMRISPVMRTRHPKAYE